MPSLSDYEIQLIHGGVYSTNDTIYVTGHRPGDDPEPPPPVYDPGDDNGGGPSGGGGSGGNPPQADYPANWDYSRDQKIDAHAGNLADKITKLPNSDKLEYGAFVWKDANGVLHESNILPGLNGSFNAGDFKPSDFGFSNWNQVVAEVHNHPDYLKANDGSYYYNTNAANASVGDIASLQAFASQVGVDSQFRSYTVHDGYVSEYDYVQNQHALSGSGGDIDYDAVRGDYNPDFSGI